jgi:competence protein ComEC
LALRFGAERERWILWTPVALGAGIGLYFSLWSEPPGWIGPLALAGTVFVAVVGRRLEYLLLPAVAGSVVAAGLTLAQLSTFAAGHVTLDRMIATSTVAGRVASVEQLPDGTRVLLDKVRISSLEPPATPERIRLRLRGKMPDLLPGAWLQVRARLAPPPPPAMPGAYDFQFHYYFQEIGATGFALGRARLLADADTQLTTAHRWEGFRERLTTRIRDAIGGTAGAVAAALITGDRGAIPEEINEAYRNSGIYHLLSISGMHIGLVAGLLFALVRAGLALIPSIALRYPIKKWAAFVAIAGALFYTLLAGATVPTQRSFVMMGLVLAAIIVDRQGISMRFVAIAATIILAFQPEALLNASFQMSFAAVVALIAAYEVWGSAFARGRDKGLARRIALYVGAVALTTVIATVATAPFSVYHFNRVALYGLLGNLIAVPLSSVWVMPAAVIGMVLMPFGLEDLGLVPMGWGIEAINEAAARIAAQDWAVTTIAAMPSSALLAMVLGGLWICLWRRSWRVYGTAGIVIGVVIASMATRPDILADGGARLFAVAGDDGRMLVSSRSTARFERDIWLRRAGYETGAEETFPRPDQGRGDSGVARDLRCDDSGCVWQAKGETVSFVTDRAALIDDCRTSSIVVSAVPVPGRRCPSARVLIDRFDLWRGGTHAIWIEKDRVRIESVNGVRGWRPWVIRPGVGRTVRPQTPVEEEDAEADVPIVAPDTDIP